MQGGDLFRLDRRSDGEPHHYDVAGLWGSGNVVTERELRPDANTLYTMWTGDGLVGPRADEALERYPAVLGRRTLGAFLAEFAAAPVDCRVMVEAPLPVDPCLDPCDAVRDACGEDAGRRCLDDCDPGTADTLAPCVEAAGADCDAIRLCFPP